MSSFIISTRLIPIVDIILALVVLGICGWTLTHTFKDGGGKISRGEIASQNSNVPVNSFIEENSSTVSRSESSDDLDTSVPNFVQKPHRLTRRYTFLLQMSLAVSLLVIVVQLVTSFMLFFTTSKKRLRRLRMWQLGHLLTIVVLCTSILVPLSYDQEKDSFRGTTSFGNYVEREVGKMLDILSNRTNAQDKVEVWSLIGVNNLYFVIISVNIFCIFVLLFTSCCFSCWRKTYPATK